MEKSTITLVRSLIGSRPYCKTDGKYIGATWKNDIGLHTISNNPKDMFELCVALSKASNTCMVTGTAIHPEITNTDRTLKNFSEEPIGYVVLDLDKYKVEGLATKSYKQVVREVDKFIKNYLPPEFQNVTYILCFSSSFLIGGKDNLKCHIIFMLEDTQYPREIGTWIKKDNIPVDSSFYFNLTQPIFTASPIWVDLVDPLSIKGDHFPRLSIIPKDKSHIPKEWHPYFVPKSSIKIAELPKASHLKGKVGSFCRKVSMNSTLLSMGYTYTEDGRYLAPSSSTGIAGVKVFDNGYVYSHHEGDPINQIVEKIYHNKRRSLNVYDLAYNWGVLNKDKDSSILADFNFMLTQAVLNDSVYQDEVLQELVYRSEWLVEGDYQGDNRQIIDGIIQDVHDLSLSELSRERIFSAIKIQTKFVRIPTLRNAWKTLNKDAASHRDTYNPDANLRHMSSIFKKQKVMYSHHKTQTGSFWCYFSELRIWKKCNNAQTKAFIYGLIHASLPIKIEINYSKSEQLANLLMRDACLSMAEFPKGKGWAFKGGRYGITMSNLFSNSHQWQSKEAVRTLRKQDHIYKELPITYKEWQDSEGVFPEQYVDFLESSCQGDLETVELIREYGGYIIADTYAIHKMLIIEGVAGSGKSIIAKILRACIGSAYHSAVSLTGMTNRFGLGVLAGKQLAIMSEARGVDFNTSKLLVPVLLRIIGRDYVDTEVKGVDVSTELLECKIVMLTNKTPVLPDDTGALAQRLLMIRLGKVFRGTSEEVLGLDELIIEEGLAPIIRWHLTGLENLSERKQFVEPESGVEAKAGLIAQIDPLKTFIETYFTISFEEDEAEYVTQSEFIMAFRAYCLRIGQPTAEAIIQKRASIRNIRIMFPLLFIKRIRKNGRVVPIINGAVANAPLNLEFAEEYYSLQ